MNESIKKELLKQESSICITEIARLIWDGGEKCYINNAEPRTVNGKEYLATGFSFSPPSDTTGAGSLEIDDTNGELAYLIQSIDKMQAEIALIDADDTSYCIEGPITFRVEEASASSDGKCTLSISLESGLSFGASKLTYSAQLFPGLYG